MKPTILNDEFFASFESSVASIEQAETLPPACYTSKEFYEFEKEALFNHEWLCVGRESWVPQPGDYFTSSIVGEPLLITHGQDGQLRAMSSVCQHRGMLVAEGRGNTRGFVCPYHHWTYALDGRLVNAPSMGKTCDFDKQRHGLPQIKVEVWQGFVFINFDEQATPLAPRLSALDAVLERYALGEAEDQPPESPGRYQWNWKVMFENNNDGYHANKLHHGPLHDFVPSSLARFPELPEDTAGYFRWNGTLHGDASFNATQKALLPIFPKLTEQDRKQMVFANVPPTLSLVLTADMIIYLILRADGPESLEMDTGLLLAPGATADPAFRHKMAINMAGAEEIMAQDWHVDELVQVGLRSRFAPRGRYSWQEGAQHDFNKWLVPRYREGWQRLRTQQA
ncbi:MAG: aromatic ring-hydroxylating dioxygenase subunit alpha [Gammaproteobacteria bacterium]|nr:MAG: aromatic ring-hydroxylating dioxygenase subunit alpha [Gammaproteobacteria bacterium]